MTLGRRLLPMVEGIVIALDAIRVNKVRAALTITGIAVGVFVVTVMSAAIHGINAGVTGSLAAAGPTTFFISKWPAEIQTCNGDADSCPWRRFPPLTLREAEAVARLPVIRGVTAHINSSVPMKYRDRELPSVALEGYTPGWTEVTAGDVRRGRSFTEGENASAAAVVILNEKASERLFGQSEPLDKIVELKGRPFRVIGIYHESGNIFDSGNKGKAIVPFETARRRLNVGTWWLD